MLFTSALRKLAVLVYSVAFIAPLFFAGCGSGGGDGSSVIGGGEGGGRLNNTALTAIAITPASVTVARGQAIKFTATGSYANGSTADITSQVAWASASTNIASITSGSGVATGVTVGSTEVTASASGITSPGASLTVSTAELTALSITPPKQTSLIGTPVAFTAIGTYSDGNSGDVTASVTWTSSNPIVASMDASGVASTLTPGHTTVNAYANGVTSNNAILTVRKLTAITISPATASVAKGLAAHFTATATYSDFSSDDISNQVVWATGDAGVATIDSSTGIATGVAVGSTTIVASASGIISPGASLAVHTAELTGISIAPTIPSAPKGAPVRFTATGSYSDGIARDVSGSVIWASTNSSVATINASGVASSMAQGTTTVTASAGGFTSNSATLTVTAPELSAISINPASANVPKWLTTRFTATGTYTDGTTAEITTQVTWATADPAIATINSSTGVATGGLTIGSTTVTALKSGLSSSGATLNVTAATLTGISITPKKISTPNGTPVTFKATGSYSDGSSADVSGSVTWVSSSEDVAKVDGSGIASSLKQGSSTVTASVSAPGSGIVTDSATLTVTAPVLTEISINPATASVAKGLTTHFTAIGIYTDATTADITSQVSWLSANTGVATISSTNTAATATGIALGSVNITASAGGVTSAAATLSVSTAVLTGISITPVSQSVPKGTPVAFTATGNYSDGSSANLSGAVIWSSADAAVAVINASGIASSLATGSTTVNASASGIISNTAALVVTPPVLANISITPTSANVTLGGIQQFTAIGIFTDGTFSNITTQVAWLSDNSAVTINSATGLATTVSAGSANISASSGLITSNLAGLVVPLAAPAGVIAVAATGNVALSWSAVPGATSYNIYWGNASGITAETRQIAGVTSPYSHAGLTDGKTYYYHVSAVNAATGEEVMSTETFSYLYPGGNPQGSFSNAGSFLKLARMGHISALLSSGKILVTAGTDVDETFYLANSEIYSPETNSFSDTGSLLVARAYATDTSLPNGKVLVIGGKTFKGYIRTYLSSAELYNPVTGMFTNTGSMTAARANHTATMLANGKVLVTGGWNGTADLATAELYDPATGIFTATGSMATARANHTATLLANGKVLVAGGCSTGDCLLGELGSAELYDPATGTFTATGSAVIKRHAHTATLLPSGKVFVVGGASTNGSYSARVEESETYDPVSGTFSSTAAIADAGNYHSAILLSNGKVIIMPCGCGAAPTGAHLYDPATDSYIVTGQSNKYKHQNSVLMPDGRILLTGGQTAGDATALPPVLPVISNDAEYFY